MKRFAIAGAIKLSNYLIDRVKPEIFDKYSKILTRDIDLKAVKKLEDINKLPEETYGDLRYKQIVYKYSNNPIGLTLVQLAALRYLYQDAQDLFDMVASGAADGVTLEIAMKVCFPEAELCDYAAEILEAYDLSTVILDYREKTDDLAREVFRFDFRLMQYMEGIDVPDLTLIDDCDFYYADSDEEIKLYGYDKQYKSFGEGLMKVYSKLDERGIGADDIISVIISGEKESGRMQFAKKFAYDSAANLFSVSFKFITSFEKPKWILSKFIRECMLMDALPCIRDIEKIDDNPIVLNRIRQMCNVFTSRPVFFLCRVDVKPVPYLKGRVFSFEIPQLDQTMRLDAWDGFSKDLKIDISVDMRPILGKMKLTSGQLYRLAKQLKNAIDQDEVLDEYKICKLCYKILDDGRYDSIKRVAPGFKLEDLKISEKNLATLRDIIGQVNGHGRVFDEWNMSSKYAYGRCVSVILAGPPGTGKTMAVHALASELGLELFKVDLSQIADKYIGETEKRLEEVFDKAEKSNMILFFDEADTVMGKRSEVKDSHDKNANNEIAFILQRMEEYDGIVILATNYLQNIDTAFMRRIRYVVNVGLPEEETRKEIWINAFAPEVPLSKDIDFDYLASQFEISGGNIKNIVLNATFYAANENTSVSMEHIMKAIYRENTKTSKGVDVFDYGNYAYLLKEL